MMTYHAEYTTTDGEMWVDMGSYATRAEAEEMLHGYGKAGNPCKITEREEERPITYEEMTEALH